MSAPSSFFLDHCDALLATTGLGPVLDLACGRGRHALAAARAGAPTLAIDRNPDFLRELSAAARAAKLPLRVLRADLESGRGIPVRPQSCGAVLVFRFLFRPLAPEIEQALAPGGLLLYETFTIHQRELGYGPSNPAFLLRPGELPRLFAGLEKLSVWEGMTSDDKPWALARLAARRPLHARPEPASSGTQDTKGRPQACRGGSGAAPRDHPPRRQAAGLPWGQRGCAPR